MMRRPAALLRRIRRLWGRGLVRRYALSFSAVALGLAVAAGGLNGVTAYRQARSSASALLTARAEMAALAVESFFAQIEGTLSWAGQASVLQFADADLERRRIFLRALQGHPAVTEIFHLDGSGVQTLRLSKRRVDGVRAADQMNFAPSPQGASATYSPVYYQHGSEPYVLMRVRDAGARAGSVFAEINLRAVWEAITRTRIGRTGYAYILDQRGELVSHFDSRLALARLDQSESVQFRSASSADAPPVGTALSISGQSVAFASAPVASLGWTVIAELPADEAYAPFYQSLRQSLAMLALALLAACAAAWLLARHMVGPLRSLQAAARRFAAGEFGGAIEVSANDEIGALAASLNEMAAQIQARERELRDSRERYALSANGARDGLWDWDLARRSIYFSSRWSRQVGLSGEARTGRLRDWFGRIDRRDRRAVAKALRAHLNGETSHLSCEYRVSTPAGVRWFLARGVVIRDASGKATRMAGSQTNITELRAALQQLADHRDHLERLVESRTAQATQLMGRLADAIETASDGIAIFDADGRCVQSNGRFSRFCGSAKERADQSPTLASVGLNLGATCHRALEMLRATGVACIEEIGPVDGLWFELRGQSLGSGDFLLRIADITPYREAASALRQALDKEREIARAHRNFVAMTSHQFRTPLAIIDAAAQRLARRKLQATPDDIEERATQIRGVVRRITDLTERTLNLSMLDAGTLAFRPVRGGLKDLVEATAAAQASVSPQHSIVAEAADDATDYVFDPTLLEQVVSNLLSNAIKFTPAGGVVRVELRHEREGARVSISDEGIGVPADELNAIFDRFFRARNAAGTSGSGLGLTLCSEIVRLHGGVLTARSVEGQGSTFAFTIPRAPAQEAAA